MKKIIFALVMLTGLTTLNAQRNSSSFKITKETEINAKTAQALTANVMATFTSKVAGAYSKGDSYNAFLSKLGANAVNAKAGVAPAYQAGNEMLAKAYKYLSTGTSVTDIIANDDGKTVANALNYAYNQSTSSKITTSGAELFNLNTTATESSTAKSGCKWYQFFCHVETFFDWVVDNWVTIKDIIILAVSL
jgi:hypothetical protein